MSNIIENHKQQSLQQIVEMGEEQACKVHKLQVKILSIQAAGKKPGSRLHTELDQAITQLQILRNLYRVVKKL